MNVLGYQYIGEQKSLIVVLQQYIGLKMVRLVWYRRFGHLDDRHDVEKPNWLYILHNAISEPATTDTALDEFSSLSCELH